MMKKTTHTLLLVFSTLLLLVSVTGSAQGQPAQDRLRGKFFAFTGTWQTVTAKGKRIVISLEQGRGNIVTGYYGVNGLTGSYKPSDRSVNGFVKVSWSPEPVPQNMSSISGTVTGNVLRFTWGEDGGHGAGRFTLSSDGESFEGTFSRTNNPDDTSGGAWNGTRQHLFAGAWQGKFGEGFMELILQQSGAQVTGEVNVNSVHLVIKEGIVDGKTLRFTLVRRDTNPRAGVRDEYLGTGELVMNRGERSFTGTILGLAGSGAVAGTLKPMR